MKSSLVMIVAIGIAMLGALAHRAEITTSAVRESNEKESALFIEKTTVKSNEDLQITLLPGKAGASSKIKLVTEDGSIIKVHMVNCENQKCYPIQRAAIPTNINPGKYFLEIYDYVSSETQRYPILVS